MLPLLFVLILSAAAPAGANDAPTAIPAGAANAISNAASAISNASAAPRGTVLDGPSLVPIALGANASINTLDPATLGTVLRHAQGGALMDIAGEPRCAITIHTLRYQTVGGHGEPTDASSVIMLPSGPDPACQGPRPVLLYAHGTVLDKQFSMARLNGEARLVAAMFVAQGFIVVAPDYAGYGASSLPYHPYLNAEQQAGDMLDALRAAREVYAQLGVRAAPRLFLSGYSQGGFVALATQRLIERDFAAEFPLVAVAGMSGPYALLQMGDGIFGGQPLLGVTAYLPLVTTSGQRAGAALYASPAELYEPDYASGIEALLPGAQRFDELVRLGRLPSGALFAVDSLPQGQGAASYFAAHNLVRSSYRQAYLADMAAHPCGAEPVDPAACPAGNGLRRWLARNDLRSYRPRAALLLCGGRDDPVVPFANASAAQRYFTARGAAPLLLDLEAADSAAPASWLAARQGFAKAKEWVQAEARDKGRDPARAVAELYHGRLAAQYCVRAARDFFLKATP
ncbi:alpha/beta hydrolase family protein [Rugamonas sp. CCM 8940]|uniref:alpha/beta hydrolase family protein n=1 Tax=Rugamonas sp. CCM 8940 TaxID=2765359 RepID=UPI0018F486A0|nr:lipase family protein [Rugamonas sp. CCM 8940]MBJ7313387.1 prolyl oligopeptidase family serine peptidase [Rugamonas sp. CCM 8940]